MKYYGICKRCGYITYLGANEPNIQVKYLNGTSHLCDYCQYPLFSIDREKKEYCLMYKDLTGEFPEKDHIEERFMERVYMQEHADEVKDIFDPELREQRIAAEDAKRAEEEAREREEQRMREIAARPVTCPKCHSTSIVTQKKGFGLGKAAAGVFLTGNVLGAAAGVAGANKPVNVCQRCGHKWKI